MSRPVAFSASTPPSPHYYAKPRFSALSRNHVPLQDGGSEDQGTVEKVVATLTTFRDMPFENDGGCQNYPAGQLALVWLVRRAFGYNQPLTGPASFVLGSHGMLGHGANRNAVPPAVEHVVRCTVQLREGVEPRDLTLNDITFKNPYAGEPTPAVLKLLNPPEDSSTS